MGHICRHYRKVWAHHSNGGFLCPGARDLAALVWILLVLKCCTLQVVKTGCYRRNNLTFYPRCRKIVIRWLVHWSWYLERHTMC